MDKAMSARMKVYEGEVKTLLRKERIRYRSLPQQDGAIMLGFADDATREQARSLVRKNFNDFDLTTNERNDLAVLRLALTQAKVTEIRDYAVKQNLTTVRNRVNELGVAEPLVQRQGANRIVVELPGVQDTAEAKRILGKTANLEFRFGAEPGASRATTEVFEFRDGGRSAAVERGLIITGDQVTDAQAGYDEHGRPQVNIRLDGHGGELMNRATRTNVGRSMAVIFIEQKPITRYEKKVVDGVEKDVAVQTFQEEKKIISLRPSSRPWVASSASPASTARVNRPNWPCCCVPVAWLHRCTSPKSAPSARAWVPTTSPRASMRRCGACCSSRCSSSPSTAASA
jgi:preprotein translocase subunit SecD